MSNNSGTKSPSDLGTIVGDVALYAGRETIISGLKYLWEVWAKSDQVTNAYALVKSGYSREALMSNLRRAVFVGFALVLLGLVIGRIGYAIQPADILTANWQNGVGRGVRDFGKFVRLLGVLYAAVWMAVLVAKGAFAITVIRTGSKAVDFARALGAQLVPDFIFPNALIQGGQIITAAEAKKYFNNILSVFIWVISLGVFTLIDGVIPVDTSLTTFGTILCTLIALYAISIYFGTNRINIAKWFNILAFAGLAISIFVNSDAFAYVQKLYAGTASQQFATKNEAAKRVVGGFSQTANDDKAILGSVLYDELEAIRVLTAKSRTECETKEMTARQKHANFLLQGLTTDVKIPNCVEEQKKQVQAEAAKANRESVSQTRQAAVDRVMTGKESKGRTPKAGEKTADGKPVEAVAGDKELLDGVYANVRELKTLEASSEKSGLCQTRIVALKKRIKAYVDVKEYADIALPACTASASAPGKSGNGGSASGGVDDLVKAMEKSQARVSELLKQ